MDIALDRPDYPALFRRQVARALDTIRTDLHSLTSVPPAAVAQTTLRALEAAGFALRMPTAWPVLRDVLRLLSPHMDRAGGGHEWLSYLKAGIAQAQASEDLPALAELWMWAGVAHRTLGDYAAARACLAQSHTAAVTVGDSFQLACTLNRLAWTERLAGNRAHALALAEEALRHLADSTSEAQLEQARAYAILGALAYDNSNNVDAESYFRQVLAIPALPCDPLRHAWAYADLGLALSAQARHDEALHCYDDALTVLAAVYAPLETAAIQLNLASVYGMMARGHEAILPAQQAYATFARLGDVRRQALAETNLGVAYRLVGRHGEAAQLLASAIARGQALGHLNLIVNGLHELALVHLATDDVAAAQAAFSEAWRTVKPMPASPRKEFLVNRLRADMPTAGMGEPAT